MPSTSMHRRSTISRRLHEAISRRVSIDTRALAVFRVFVALLILADLGLRSRNFHLFYTEHGVVPRSLARDIAAPYAFSFYHLSTSTTVIAALFVVQGLFALQLLVGYRTRLAMIASFLFVISLDHHNPLVLSYADTLFRLLTFWAIFLPIGERWSIDAAHREREPRTAIASVASALILGQMVFMYVSNGVIKSVSTTWRAGEAAPLVLGLDEMTFLLGDTAREFTTLLGYGGMLWYLMMIGGWLLLVTHGWSRLALLTLYVGGHLSFALTVRIGAFAYVALAGLVLFVQTPVWDRLEAFVTTRPEAVRLESLRDRLCAAARSVPNPQTRSSRVRQYRSITYTATMVIIVVTILFVSVVIAAQSVATVVDHDGEQPIEEAIDEMLVESYQETVGVREVHTVASSLGIDQPIGWGVFAPEPRTVDRYYVFAAVTESGEYVDVYNDRPLTYDRPHDELQKQYGTYRERFYMNSVRRGGYHTDTAAMLGDHLCERWAVENEGELVQINMYIVSEQVTHETISDPESRDRQYRQFYRHSCESNVLQPMPTPP
ncbi:HTTM domain-containing protein [Natronosalvus vescus]|uniref:HTTM domain-containing protein n=1 Tax=Natronosalvus vescus TaxID=2953881 RepID=UPI002091DB05|nr:HTTM domain-containing protein [Natronosalvus vescus]